MPNHVLAGTGGNLERPPGAVATQSGHEVGDRSGIALRGGQVQPAIAQVLGDPRRRGQGPAGHRVNLSGLSAVMTSDGRSDGRPATSAAVRRAAAGAVWNP